jgi:hypothetical protein
MCRQCTKIDCPGPTRDAGRKENSAGLRLFREVMPVARVSQAWRPPPLSVAIDGEATLTGGAGRHREDRGVQEGGLPVPLQL